MCSVLIISKLVYNDSYGTHKFAFCFLLNKLSQFLKNNETIFLFFYDLKPISEKNFFFNCFKISILLKASPLFEWDLLIEIKESKEKKLALLKRKNDNESER